MKMFPRYLIVLRNRDYLLFWLAQTLTYFIGIGSSLAFLLLVLKVTQSPIQAGILAGLSAFTYVIVSLFASTLIDRWNRKWTMIGCMVGLALCFLSVPLILAQGHLAFLLVYPIVFLEATIRTLFDSVKLSSRLGSISVEDQPVTTVFLQITLGVSFLGGPLCASLLFTINPTWPFLLAALFNGISALCLFMIQGSVESQSSGKRDVTDWHRKMKEGWNSLKSQPILFFMAWTTSIERFLSEGYILIVIVLILQQNISSVMIGLIFAAGGIGGIAGSLVAPWFQARFQFALAILGVLWLEALLWFLIAALPGLFVLVLITTFLFFSSPIYSVVYINYRHKLTPADLHEQVDTTARLISSSLWPLSLVLTGILLQYSGPRITLLVGAIGLAILSLIATLTPLVRSVRPSSATSVDSLSR